MVSNYGFPLIICALCLSCNAKDHLRTRDDAPEQHRGHEFLESATEVIDVYGGLEEDHDGQLRLLNAEGHTVERNEEGRNLTSKSTKLVVENTCNDMAFVSLKYTSLSGPQNKYLFLRSHQQFVEANLANPVFTLSGNCNSFAWNQRVNVGSLDPPQVKHDLVCVNTPAPTPRPTRRPTPAPTKPKEQQWLDAHNSRRRELFRKSGLSAADVKWSKNIARSAENYARRLVALDGCKLKHGVGGDRYGGENLAMHWSRAGKGAPPDFILKMWYDREKDNPFLEKLHYTQVGWRSTRYVGCGKARKQIWGGFCDIHVCRYISRGNCAISESNWKSKMLQDQQSSKCGPHCPPEGCF